MQYNNLPGHVGFVRTRCVGSKLGFLADDCFISLDSFVEIRSNSGPSFVSGVLALFDCLDPIFLEVVFLETAFLWTELLETELVHCTIVLRNKENSSVFSPFYFSPGNAVPGIWLPMFPGSRDVLVGDVVWVQVLDVNS